MQSFFSLFNRYLVEKAKHEVMYVNLLSLFIASGITLNHAPASQ